MLLADGYRTTTRCSDFPRRGRAGRSHSTPHSANETASSTDEPGALLSFHPRLTVDHGHRPRWAAARILGAGLAVPVQRALRHHHTLAGQQVTDLDHRQALIDPASDAVVVDAQNFPR